MSFFKLFKRQNFSNCDIPLTNIPLLTLENSTSILSKVHGNLQRELEAGSPEVDDDVSQKEIVLRRWLQAYSGNVHLASEMLRRSMDWRRANKISDILKDNWIELLKSVLPVHLRSVDKLQRPVVYIPLHKWKLGKIPRLARSGDFHRFVVSFYEMLMGELAKTSVLESSYEAHKFFVVIDMRGISSVQLLNWKVTKYLMLFPQVLEAHYPGTLHKCVVINCGSRLNKIVTRLILRPSLWRKCRTPSSIDIYYEHSNWPNVLRSWIPSEELLVDYGGWKQ